VLYVTLIPRLGVTGAAIASSGAYIATALLAIVAVCRIIPMSPKDLLVLRRGDVAWSVDQLRHGVGRLRRGATSLLVTPRAQRVAKRGLDLLVCLVAVPVTLPLAALIGLIVRIDLGGPVIFRQPRVGENGKTFDLFKFRTLRGTVEPTSAERAFMVAYIRGETEPPGTADDAQKPDHSARMTPVGAWLRRMSLDELPQLLNVLRGEMSLVGPRPHVPWEVAAYTDRQRRRLEVLPGITGWAQVKGRSSLDFETMTAYDIEYIERRSLALDLKILALTLRAIVRGDGTR
jgi:lipopolysaccharide/colanic/teichoic acid biosynthesis glycosyltransferase